MTPSQRIRAAALYERTHPHFVDMFSDDEEAWAAVYDFARGPGGVWPHWISDFERRMFLLFVAEALES